MSLSDNKPRLYIVNFARTTTEGNNPDPYHWGLTSGPKDGNTIGMLLYHVRNVYSSNGVQWIREEPPRDLSPGPTPLTLTFTAVAKITDLARLQQVIRNVPVDADAPWTTFNCRIWVEKALQAIAQDGGCIGTNVLGKGWAVLEQQCDTFAKPYRQMLVDGKGLPAPRKIQNLVG